MECVPKPKDLSDGRRPPQGALLNMTSPDEGNGAPRFPQGKKFHLFTPEIDEYIKRATPEQKDSALKLTEEYLMLLSSGRHMDSGVNGAMRNP